MRPPRTTLNLYLRVCPEYAPPSRRRRDPSRVGSPGMGEMTEHLSEAQRLIHEAALPLLKVCYFLVAALRAASTDEQRQVIQNRIEALERAMRALEDLQWDTER